MPTAPNSTPPGGDQQLLIDALRHYWSGSAHEAHQRWQATIRDDPALAISVLNCIHLNLQNPPDDPTELIGQRAGIRTDEMLPARSRPLTNVDYLDWLQELYTEWEAAFLRDR